MDGIKVFVYGTLIQGQHNHRVAEPFLLEAKEGAVKGNLFSVGGFPALALDGENQIEVKGQWFTVAEEGLKNMDRLEGYQEGSPYNHYERVRVTDINGVDEGFVYVYSMKKCIGRGLPVIESGSWVEYHQARRKAYQY